MNQELIHIMLIGSMKCGTSTLYNHLIKHPEIAEGIVKEPEYFSINMGDPDLKKRSYENLFKINLGQHKFTLDASTGYSKYPAEKGVPERIKEYGIKPCFIYIVRNPFDRIRSHYNYMKSDLNWKNEIDSPHLINTSKYYTQIQEYVKIFPGAKILILEFDNLKNDPVRLCNEIFSFIGATFFRIFLEENSIKNETWAVNKKQLILKKKLREYRIYFPSFLKKMFNYLLDLIFPRKQEYLSARQKKLIKQQLTEDMKNLQTTYSIDISKWGF